MNRLLEIQQLGQSIWLDMLDRKIMDTGELQRLIDEDGLRGLTSNPTIFEKAISNSKDYDNDIENLAKKEDANEAIFFNLAIKDIKRAADLFKPVYDKTKGEDGFVSLEVSPFLAHDTEGTIRQARDLWKRVGRNNVMIKIPSTTEGLSAIRTCIAEGININITLLFGLPRYKEVMEAYLEGLEDRVRANKSVDNIASVASFFLSRIDVIIDSILREKGINGLKGEVAIASAKKAYNIYQETFTSDRFNALKAKGAKSQRVLWASTSAKDPAFSDVKYVEALIGRNTINTLPIDTLNAFRNHGLVSNNLTENLGQATEVLQCLKDNGIYLDAITQKLEDDGIEKFNASFEALLNGIETKK